MAFQYFLINPAALASIGMTSAHSTVTIVSAGSPQQPALFLADPAHVQVPACAHPVAHAADLFFPAREPVIPTVPVLPPAQATQPSIALSPADSLQIRGLASELAVNFAALVDTEQRPVEHTDPEPIRQVVEEWLLGRVLSQNEAVHTVMNETRLICAAIGEMVWLHDVPNFATDLIRDRVKTLSLLGHDFEHFCRFLFEEISNYISNRNTLESHFVAPYQAALEELNPLIERATESLNNVFITGRIKEGLLQKMVRRSWKDWSEFYDFAGLRVVVDRPQDITRAQDMITHILHNSEFEDDRGYTYQYRANEPDIKGPENNDRGYRGVHLDIDRVNHLGVRSEATAEIQIMTRGISRWGEIQRQLVYKSEATHSDHAESTEYSQRLEATADELKRYCRAAADFIYSCEAGIVPESIPELDHSVIDNIPDLKRRAFYHQQARKMDALMREFATQPTI